ncbi:MAG: hypothetical protein LUQ27_02750 [Methanomassiliicoccales archaeon]|nr:hypothetical protein [Methanomassiliicoccales archaeon]
MTVVIERLLSARDKQSLLNKLNMVIGAFFSEVGTHLLRKMSNLDPAVEELRGNLVMKGDWTDKEFDKAMDGMKNHRYEVAVQRSDLKDIREFLTKKREFLLGLLENPNLLEHESFTELLWAVFHFAEELDARTDLLTIPQSDLEHLTNDAKRAYSLLAREWLSHLRHLKNNYPYLFSLAARTNPFNPSAVPEVSGP